MLGVGAGGYRTGNTKKDPQDRGVEKRGQRNLLASILGRLLASDRLGLFLLLLVFSHSAKMVGGGKREKRERRGRFRCC